MLAFSWDCRQSGYSCLAGILLIHSFSVKNVFPETLNSPILKPFQHLLCNTNKLWFPAPPAKTPTSKKITVHPFPNPKTMNIQIGHLPYRSILQLCKALAPNFKPTSDCNWKCCFFGGESSSIRWETWLFSSPSISVLLWNLADSWRL